VDGIRDEVGWVLTFQIVYFSNVFAIEMVWSASLALFVGGGSAVVKSMFFVRSPTQG